jgi:ABC-type branched-subunit amino acid transport system substrate-binding protein
MAMLVSSVPLSLTIIIGRPRRAITASSSRPTRVPDNDVSATNAMHSRVKSSTTARISVSQLAKEKNRIAIISGSGASRLTNDACTPNSIHYTYDTYALARGTGSALMKAGEKSWYFLTADYAFGHALEADTSAVVKAMGGEVVGSTRYPIETFDQSSFLLQAQASKAQVVALAGSGNVLVNAIKSAQEFGIPKGGHPQRTYLHGRRGGIRIYIG